ncbi:G-patch domain and KOW motifs-containing protein [Schistosoma japonicum]|nr:G-patch domain and KOW motifs-containing protein [Schistosoma japonicum]
MSDLKSKIAFSFNQRKKQLVGNNKISALAANNDQNITGIKKEFISLIEDKRMHALREIKEGIISVFRTSKNLESQAPSCDSYNSHINCDVKIPCSSGVIEETEDANYDAVPIEKFGIALLSGMGFDPKSVDTSKKYPRFINILPCRDALYPQRPKGLGLGANPAAVQVAKHELLKSKTEDLTWIPGACCQVVLGKNKGLYGKVNQIEVDEYKAHEAEQLLQKSYNSDSDLSRSRSNRIEKSTHRDSSRTTSKISEDDKQLKYEPNSSSSSTAWLRPKLIVRCLDRNYCGGKYNGEKLIIVSVDANRCSCKTESGQIIKGVPANYLQTVVPYEMNSILMIVKGERNGQLTRLIKRDGRNQLVDVKTRSGIPLQCHFDCVCAVYDPFGD